MATPVSMRRLMTFAALLTLWTAFAAFVLWGINRLPFHPDESTYIFMSRDFDLLVLDGNPSSLIWKPGQAVDAGMRYRLLDAPLIRYLIGLSRSLVGHPATQLPADWNWSASWEANVRAGALPSASLLFVARLPAALLAAVAPLLVFNLGRRLAGLATGLGAALLYALNSLILLHTRRAMTEGPMLFFMLLAIWLVLRYPRRSLLLGLVSALAVAAKLTNLALLPVVILALWTAPLSKESGRVSRPRQRARALLGFATAFAVTTFVLNPLLWGAPGAALRAMAHARLELLSAQTNALRSVAPDWVLPGFGSRLLATVYEVYVAPLAFKDVANYAYQTQALELSYLSVPLHHVLRFSSVTASLGSGAVLLALTLAGMAWGGLALYRRQRSETLTLLWLWTLSTVAVLSTIPVLWQRYYLPLVPIISLWAAYGFGPLFVAAAHLLKSAWAGWRRYRES